MANHTTPIDIAMLAVDNCFTLVSECMWLQIVSQSDKHTLSENTSLYRYFNEGGLTRPQTAFEKRTGSQVNRQMFMDILLNNLVLSFERLVPLFGDM